MGGLVVGVGKIKINNHLSPVDTGAGTELGNYLQIVHYADKTNCF